MHPRLQLHLGTLPESCTAHLLQHAARRGFAVDELRGIGAAHGVWKRVDELAPYAESVQRRAQASPFDAAVAHIEWSGIIQGIRQRTCRALTCNDDPAERFFATIGAASFSRPALSRSHPEDKVRSSALQNLWREQTHSTDAPQCLIPLGIALRRVSPNDFNLSAWDDAAMVTYLRLRLAVAESAILPMHWVVRQIHSIDTIHAVALRGWLLGASVHLPETYATFIRGHLSTVMKRALISGLSFLENIPDALAQKQKALHALADAVAASDPDYAESLRAEEAKIVSLALLRNTSIESAIDHYIGG